MGVAFSACAPWESGTRHWTFPDGPIHLRPQARLSTIAQGQEERASHQQPPIPLPSDALAEVLSFLPRADRIRMALLNDQVATILVLSLSTETKKLAHTLPAAIERCDDELNAAYDARPELIDRRDVLSWTCKVLSEVNYHLLAQDVWLRVAKENEESYETSKACFQAFTTGDYTTAYELSIAYSDTKAGIALLLSNEFQLASQEEIAGSFKELYDAELAVKEVFKECIRLESTVDRLRNELRAIQDGVGSGA